MSPRVAVANGGRSLEREISLRSGHRAAWALRRLGYETHEIDPDHRFVHQVRAMRPDFVFVAMHGRGGEDGTLQDLLEILHIPYTGSDVHASARCLDKHAFKELIAREGLATPAWHSFNRDAFAEFGAAETLPELTSQMGFPLVVKPARQGSSLGIKFVRSSDEFGQSVLGALNYDDRVVIEQYVSGRELAVTVVGAADEPVALPIVEITFDEAYYTFRAHYDPGIARLAVPQLEDGLVATVAEAACRAYSLAGCRDFARVDILLDRNNVPQILEVNTIPGLTETGPARFAAEAAGMSFTDFVERIVARAAERARAKL